MTRSDGDGSTLHGLSGVQETPEDEKEAIRQQLEAQLIAILESDHNQTRLLKKILVPSVVFVIVAFGALLFILFFCVIINHPWGTNLEETMNVEASIIPWALFVSLIFSITTMIVALLVGVFRTPQGGAVEAILTHGGRAAAGSS